MSSDNSKRRSILFTFFPKEKEKEQKFEVLNRKKIVAPAAKASSASSVPKTVAKPARNPYVKSAAAPAPAIKQPQAVQRRSTSPTRPQQQVRKTSSPLKSKNKAKTETETISQFDIPMANLNVDATGLPPVKDFNSTFNVPPVTIKGRSVSLMASGRETFRRKPPQLNTVVDDVVKRIDHEDPSITETASPAATYNESVYSGSYQDSVNVTSIVGSRVSLMKLEPEPEAAQLVTSQPAMQLESQPKLDSLQVAELTKEEGQQSQDEEFPGENLPGELPNEELLNEELPGELPNEELPEEKLPGEELPGVKSQAEEIENPLEKAQHYDEPLTHEERHFDEPKLPLDELPAEPKHQEPQYETEQQNEDQPVQFPSDEFKSNIFPKIPSLIRYPDSFPTTSKAHYRKTSDLLSIEQENSDSEDSEDNDNDSNNKLDFKQPTFKFGYSNSSGISSTEFFDAQDDLVENNNSANTSTDAEANTTQETIEQDSVLPLINKKIRPLEFHRKTKSIATEASIYSTHYDNKDNNKRDTSHGKQLSLSDDLLRDIEIFHQETTKNLNNDDDDDEEEDDDSEKHGQLSPISPLKVALEPKVPNLIDSPIKNEIKVDEESSLFQDSDDEKQQIDNANKNFAKLAIDSDGSLSPEINYKTKSLSPEIDQEKHSLLDIPDDLIPHVASSSVDNEGESDERGSSIEKQSFHYQPPQRKFHVVNTGDYSDDDEEEEDSDDDEAYREVSSENDDEFSYSGSFYNEDEKLNTNYTIVNQDNEQSSIEHDAYTEGDEKEQADNSESEGFTSSSDYNDESQELSFQARPAVVSEYNLDNIPMLPTNKSVHISEPPQVSVPALTATESRDISIPSSPERSEFPQEETEVQDEDDADDYQQFVKKQEEQQQQNLTVPVYDRREGVVAPVQYVKYKGLSRRPPPLTNGPITTRTARSLSNADPNPNLYNIAPLKPEDELQASQLLDSHVAERSGYIEMLRLRDGTANSSVSCSKWGLPIGISDNNKTLKLSAASKTAIRKTVHSSRNDLKHGKIRPRLLASEVDENDQQQQVGVSGSSKLNINISEIQDNSLFDRNHSRQSSIGSPNAYPITINSPQKKDFDVSVQRSGTLLDNRQNAQIAIARSGSVVNAPAKNMTLYIANPDIE